MADISDLHFDASQVEPNQGIDPIPEGDYQALVESSDVKIAGSGGRYIKLTFRVLGGAYNGRKVFEQITIENASAVAVQIGKGTLSSLCRAIGVNVPLDTVELHNRPLSISVKLKPRSDKPGTMVNRISSYSPAGAPVAMPPVANPPQGNGVGPVDGKAPLSGPNQPPWQRAG